MSDTADKFDLSDVATPAAFEPPNDTLDDVLAVAADVLADYGEDQASSHTRIARMAWWLIENVGGEPHQTERAGSIARYTTPSLPVRPLVRVGSIYAVEQKDDVKATHTGFAVGDEAALAFATAIIRATETSERDA